MPEESLDIQKIFAEGHLIDEALKKGALEALKVHQRAGIPLAIWRDGQVQWVSPEDFERDLARAKSA